MESDLSPLEWPNGPSVHLHESSSFLTEKEINAHLLSNGHCVVFQES